MVLKAALVMWSFLVASATPDGHLRAQVNRSNASLSHVDQSFSAENLTTHLLDGFRVVAKALGMESTFNESLSRMASNETRSGSRNCLCIFDIDRTITGKQGRTWGECSANKVVGGYDDAYGGGSVTLSHLGQNIWSTWCGRECHVRGISAHHSARPNIPIPQNVLRCNRGCKARRAKRMARDLGIQKSEVYMFDDKANNIRPFHGTGMNAHQVSCGTRDGDHGLCGGTTSELTRDHGVATCR